MDHDSRLEVGNLALFGRPLQLLPKLSTVIEAEASILDDKILEFSQGIGACQQTSVQIFFSALPQFVDKGPV